MRHTTSATTGSPILRPLMPELDTLRGIAVLGVLFLHGFEWQFGGLHFSRLAHLFVAVTQPGSSGAVAVAYLSRRYFEERFLKLKDNLPWAQTQSEMVPSAQQIATLPAAS